MGISSLFRSGTTFYAARLKQLSARATPLLYSASAVATSGAQLIAGVLMVRWIVPEELGVWRSAQLFQTYGFIMLMGINNGLSRELPYALGKNDHTFSDQLAGSALFVTNTASSLVLVGGLGYGSVNHHMGPNELYAIAAMTLMIPLAFYQNYFIVSYRSGDSFKKLTRIQNVEAVLSLATLPLVYYFHYAGMLIRTVAILAVVVGFLYKNCPIKPAPHLDRPALKILFKTGFPIFWLDYIKNAAGTASTIVVLRFGGAEAVGFFALSQIIFRTLVIIPQSLAQYVYPRMTYTFGQNGDKLALWRMGMRFFMFATALVILGGICAYWVIPQIVPSFAPKYVPGIGASKIILLATVFESACVVVNALWSIKSWKHMVTYQLGSAALLILGPVLGVFFLGKTLEGVTWGITVGSAARCGIAIWTTYHATHAYESTAESKSGKPRANQAAP